MNLVIAVIVGLILYAGVIFGGVCAWKDGFLTVTQMQNKGIERGLPWIWHGGMIGDFFLVNPVCIIGTYFYSDQWSLVEWTIVMFVCSQISLRLHEYYIKNKTIEESHIEGDKLSATGSVHLLYMMFALGIVLLIYLCTSNIEQKFLLWASGILTIHIFFGTHCHLKIWNPPWFGIAFRKSDFVVPGAVAFTTTGITIIHTYLSR